MNDTESKPVLIAGAGGHAKVLLETLRKQRRRIYGLCDANPEMARTRFPQEIIIGDDEAAFVLSPNDISIVIGVGSARSPALRATLFERYSKRGFRFTTIIHPSAIIADDAEIHEGAQIMAGAVIQPGTAIGANAVVNTRASIDHDCRIGDHAFIAPGVTLCGEVSVGSGAHVGAGATVLEGRSVGAGATVGGGALVNRNIGDGMTVTGVPAAAHGNSRQA